MIIKSIFALMIICAISMNSLVITEQYSMIKSSPPPKIKEVAVVKKEEVIAHKSITSRGLTSDIRITNNLLKGIKPIGMTATTYDLSVASCGKAKTHKLYGITASGLRVQKNRTVAVDRSVIKLGTILYIEFPKEYGRMDGIYVADDTGSAIKGNRIDIFLGEDVQGQNAVHRQCMEFGKRNVFVYIIKRPDGGVNHENQ